MDGFPASFLLVLTLGAAALGAAALAAPAVRRRYRRRRIAQAIHQFRIRREQLEAKFERIARAKSAGRDLTWKVFQWQSDVAFGLATDTGLLTAFVSVGVIVAPDGDEEDGDEEETPHSKLSGTDAADAGPLQSGAAVFHYYRGTWGTGGRVLLNTTPAQALTQLRDQFLPVGPDWNSGSSG